jgi:hypothetical protein
VTDDDVRPRFSWRRHVLVPLFWLALAVVIGLLAFLGGSEY